MEGASRGIVQQVLTKDNYERWKILMRNYLRGKDLWEVVENGLNSTNVDDSTKRDAEALHIIQLSCGRKIFDEIKHFETAKNAWNFLASRYGSEIKAELPATEPDVVVHIVDHYAVLSSLVKRKDDGKGAKSYIQTTRDELLLPRGSDERTVLHVATMAGNVEVVDVLVEEEERLLTMQDKRGYTALALAADLTGNVAVAECLVKYCDSSICQNLLAIANNNGETPILLAARKGHKDMTRFLFDQYKKEHIQQHLCNNLLMPCIKGEIFDVALELLQSNPNLDQLPTDSLFNVFRAMNALATMPSAFSSGCQLPFHQQIIYQSWFCGPILNLLHLSGEVLGELLDKAPIQILRRLNIFGSRVYEKKRIHSQVKEILKFMKNNVKKLNNSKLHQASVYDAMLDAAKYGTVEFIEAMNEGNHDLLRAADNHKRGIFSYAILHRKQKVFQLIYNLNGRKDIIKYETDLFDNNLLHLAAHLGPYSDVNDGAGAALQMQRELQWFKAVEEVVSPNCKEAKNDDGKKPRELFTDTHKELVKEGEKWAKQAAKSFALVGILITTIMFAAAFTVPGGNDEKKGVPIFSNDSFLTAFLIADEISLFTSSTSVLIFIWILTSRFAEEDFLKILPCKLLFGLFFLFLSVGSMIIAFCAALGIVLKDYQAYMQLAVPGVIFGIIPVIVLIPSQVTLIWKILRSTFSNPIRLRIR